MAMTREAVLAEKRAAQAALRNGAGCRSADERDEYWRTNNALAKDIATLMSAEDDIARLDGKIMSLQASLEKARKAETTITAAIAASPDWRQIADGANAIGPGLMRKRCQLR